MDMYDSKRNRWHKSRNSCQSHTPAGSSVRDLYLCKNTPGERHCFPIPAFNPYIQQARWRKYGILWHISGISALNLRMKVELISYLWFLPNSIGVLKDIWIMEGLRRSLIFVYLHWSSLHTKGTEWNVFLLSWPTYLFWFLWVFFVNLGPSELHGNQKHE